MLNHAAGMVIAKEMPVGNFQFRRKDLFRECLTILLTAVVLTAVSGFHTIQAQSAKSLSETEIRSTVAKAGIGRDARVEAKLSDGSKVKGFISANEAESFTITDLRTGASQTVTYANVASIKKSRRGLSPLTWGILGGAAAAVLIVGLTVIKPVVCDGGAGC
jgi:hypothetical protein